MWTHIVIYLSILCKFYTSNNCVQMRFAATRTLADYFKLRRVQAKTKMKTDIVNEFLFADDCALDTTTKANKQNRVDKFSVAVTILA